MNCKVWPKCQLLVILLLFLDLMSFLHADASSQKPELVVETGHLRGITSVAYSPDGKIVASGSDDSTVKLWDASSGTEVRTLKGHSKPVKTIAFSPDGKTLASGGYGEMIKLWDFGSGQELRTLSTPSHAVGSIAFGPDGTTLAGASANSVVGLIWLWDVKSGRQLRTLSGRHSPDPRYLNQTKSVAFSRDGKKLFSASEDKTIKVWDATNGNELQILRGHSDSVSSVALSPDGKILVSGSWDHTIKVWDAISGTELQTLRTTAWITSVVFSPDGKFLASSSLDRTIKLWSVVSWTELRTLSGHTDVVNSVAFSGNGKILASGGSDATIRLWDAGSGMALKTLKGHSGIVDSVALNPNGKILASGALDGTIKVWDTASGTLTRTFRGHSKSVTALIFKPDGTILASGGQDGTIKLWDTTTWGEVRTLSGTNHIVSIAFSPDGANLASSSWESLSTKVKLWDPINGTVLRTLTSLPTDANWSITFTADGKIMGCANSGKKIVLWDEATGAEVPTSIGRPDVVTPIAFSSGRILAGGSPDKTIKLWDPKTGSALQTLSGHPVGVSNVAFSSDGKTLASAGLDGTIKLWNITAGKEIASLVAIDDHDWAVVTPEGRFDASPKGMELMHWMVGNEVIALGQLKERYYEPGLLAKLMGFNSEPLREINEFRDVKMVPAVEYDPPKSGSNDLTIKLTNRGGGIGQVQVFVNDKEFIADARPAGFNPSTKEATLTVDLAGASKIAGKENVIRVIARNTEGYLSSRGSVEVWEPPGSSNTPLPELYAIVAGISDYAGEQLDLSFAAKDAEDIAQTLELGAKRLFGAERVHLKLLTTNATNRSAVPPTKANFRKAFEEFRRAKPTDLLIIYVAGHGVTLQQGNDMYLYLTGEARTTDKTTLLDPAVRQQTTISSDELAEWTKAIPALKQVMILDTCAAGAAGMKLVEKRDVSGDQIRAIERLKDRTGVHVLMGSAADAVSYEASQYGQGLLTYSLLQGMRGAALLPDGQVDVSKLFNYAADQVPQLARNVGGVQRPQIRVPSGGTSFAIGMLTEQEKRLVPLSLVKPLVLRPLITLQELGDDTIGVIRELRKLLRDASYVSVRGEAVQPLLVYVDEDDLPGAIRPTGTYTIEGERVRLKLFLRRDGRTVASLPLIEGSQRDVADLAVKIMAAINEALKNEHISRKTFSERGEL